MALLNEFAASLTVPGWQNGGVFRCRRSELFGNLDRGIYGSFGRSFSNWQPAGVFEEGAFTAQLHVFLVVFCRVNLSWLCIRCPWP